MKVLETLGYLDSPKFIRPSKLDALPPSELIFALRKYRTSQEFEGAYVIQKAPKEPAIPIVYAFKVESDEVAKKIHRLVWNQNLAPFIIIESRSTIRIYSGFDYDKHNDTVLAVPKDAANILESLAAFHSEAIDDGTVWQKCGIKIDPTKRVDETLLHDLKELDHILQHKSKQSERLTRSASHGLIGKFVYLRYLRDREILSDRKLEKWNINGHDVFSRGATLKAFHELNDNLQKELNGSVFSMGDEVLSKISQSQLREVAGVFSGDSASGQLHLDFKAYDFSYIPIETLSCVYEQFLHDNIDEDGKSRGERLSAYYTPIPLTDYMISELESRLPLEEGMKILDPSCGSGSFLVQCYRRLIEKKFRHEKRRPKPTELRDLLVKHIFGVDRDEDACRVAELSLILTLLDYIEPPDLENTTFKLPILRGRNIFESDFFDPDSEWQKTMQSERFDWIIGNPPWDEVTGKPSLEHEHYFAWQWIKGHKSSFSTGGNQIAEYFLWKVGEHVSKKGVIGLLVPAMTWFKEESITFRRQFFSERQVWCLSNFSNMAFVLFAGRITPRASAVFFKCVRPNAGHRITSFAPFVIEQIANRPQGLKKKLPTWNIVINSNEIRDVPNEQVDTGEMLPWKIAMWGSSRDERLLRKLDDRFPKLKVLESDLEIISHQGFELREQKSSKIEALEEHSDLVGKYKLDMQAIRNIGRIFSFPDFSLKKITEKERFVRRGRSKLPMKVSTPPHIILHAARQFAVFSNQFIAVPDRQVGISGSKNREKFLRALSLYLSSDFCRYHQFLSSPQFGIERDIADLKTLRKLPVPLNLLSDKELNNWSKIQQELGTLSQKQYKSMGWQDYDKDRFDLLVAEVNSRVFDILHLRSSEKILIEDFVQINFELMSGKVAAETTRKPTLQEMETYITTLRNILDGFLSKDQGIRHKIEVIHNPESALISVSIAKANTAIHFKIYEATNKEGDSLRIIRDSLRRKHSQWVYFDRGLKIYEGRTLYQFKPMQRLHWSRRQAILDADEIIAETLNEGDN